MSIYMKYWTSLKENVSHILFITSDMSHIVFSWCMSRQEQQISFKNVLFYTEIYKNKNSNNNFKARCIQSSARGRTDDAVGE